MAVPPSKLAVLLLLSTLLLLLLPSPSFGQEVENEKEFSYKPGSENGPENWGQIHEEWAECSNGKLQSPIDLIHERVVVVDGPGHLRRAYRPAPAILMNRGHDIMVKWEGDAGGVWINGTEYMLRQLHWHSSSEHTITGRRYIMELHLVHESADKKIAVVGILYKLGRPDTFLAQMAESITKLTDMEEADVKLGEVDPWDVEWGRLRKYYRYMGSLTTPPCTQGVLWTILKKVRTVSRKQVKMLKMAVHEEFKENARPIQATNKREVLLYRQKNKAIE